MFASRRRRGLIERWRDHLWPRAGLIRAWRYQMHRLARLKVSPHKLALGFAAGAFCAFSPLFGLHIALAVIIAAGLRANVVAAALGTVIGNPVTFPLLTIASYDVGEVLLGETAPSAARLPVMEPSAGLFSDGPAAFATAAWHQLQPVFLPLFMGSAVLGLAAAGASYFTMRSAIDRLKRRQARRLLSSSAATSRP